MEVRKRARSASQKEGKEEEKQNEGEKKEMTEKKKENEEGRKLLTKTGGKKLYRGDHFRLICRFTPLWDDRRHWSSVRVDYSAADATRGVDELKD